ncbi:MAG: hypothetical protein M1837_006496 [Sclerophora amabilis]|nr:MAG: hypothetical protein M1837_006496 [Sclerophora amabilis]
MDIPIAKDVFGTTGEQLIPQIIINYRRHDTTGLQPAMMMLWAIAGLPLGVYNIVENFSIALWIQPQILTTLSLVTWAQCQYYGKHWSITRCILFTSCIAVAVAGTQAALIVALRVGRTRHVTWPITLMAVLSAALLAAGVLRHYWDIYVHRTVRGISFIFVGIDAAGDLTSLISVLFEPSINILGMVIYGTELVLWMGVFACAGYYNFTPWLKQRAAARNRQRRGEHEEGPSPSIEGINLHEMPSSTSVFRTPSQSEGTSRRTVANRDLDDGVA